MDELNKKSKKSNMEHQKDELEDNGMREKKRQKISVPPPSLYVASSRKGGGIDSRIVTYHDPKAPIAEQYRILRTNIQRLTPENPPRVIAVTSALHQEGKTTTAINLSVVMAQDLHKKILLCDCDLRKPMVHKLMGIDSNKGIAEILLYDADIESVLHTGKVENLTILPCGKRPPNPAELLGSYKMKELINELRTKFDYIIIDTPPVLAITDVGIIADYIDGVIFAVQAWRTQREAVLRSQALLTAARAKILGFVLTNVEHFVPRYLYHYGYGYQYGYYHYA
ncbi:MAG: CpsD/CapB family tyrosine-protein kinase [bacterium]